MKPKIIFWLNAFLLQYCLAYSLQKKYDADFYAVVDITNNPKKFFQSQQLVKFEKTWFYHDSINKMNKKPDTSYLKQFEQKYNVNLWKLAINERIFYRFNRLHKFSTNDILLILEQECKFFEKILDETKPDFLISFDPPFHHQQLFYEMCRSNGVKPLILYIMPVGDRSLISDGYNISLKELDNVKGKNLNFEELQNYRKSFDYNKVTKKFLQEKHYSKFSQIKAIREFILHSNSKNSETHYTYFGRNKFSVLLDAIKFSLRTKYRNNFINKNLEMHPDLDSHYVYFGLAVDEETNILQSAPFYTNQIEAIRHIAKSIPINHKLFVKEHPHQEIRGWRSISEYTEIMNIPNVTLLHPSFSAEKLVQNCSLAITVRGNTCLDAAFYKKPSIVFGDTSWSALPSVHKVSSPEELPSVIRDSLQKQVESFYLDKYISWMEQNSFSFNVSDYELKEANWFYPGGILVDVDIPIPKMKSFLEKNKSLLDNLASEYIKKIEITNEKQHT